MIGDDVEITVLWCDGNKVRIGITAPDEIPVHRTEIYLAIKEQGGERAGSKRRERLRAGRQAG